MTQPRILCYCLISKFKYIPYRAYVCLGGKINNCHLYTNKLKEKCILVAFAGLFLYIHRLIFCAFERYSCVLLHQR